MVNLKSDMTIMDYNQTLDSDLLGATTAAMFAGGWVFKAFISLLI